MAVPRVAIIIIAQHQRRQLYRIRRKAEPNEGCALLLGSFRNKRTSAMVTQVVEMENVARSTSTFTIDPEHHYHILTAAEKENLEQVGIFHSHPAPPYPSGWDLQYMEYNPCVWIIDGIQGRRRKMKAFQLIEGQLYSVRIQTVLE